MPTSQSQPLRVIHVVESLGTGAVENWLLRMLRYARTMGVPLDWTFYCTLPNVGRREQVARELGATVIRSPVGLRDALQFVRHLRRTLRSGRYDVLHCHHDVMSAVYLLAAVGIRIRRRIVHVHNADVSIPTPNRFKAALVREPFRRIALALSDRIAGISRHTLEHFVGAPRAGRDSVVYYGVDCDPFRAPAPDRIAVRSSLGLKPSARILLFLGRMAWHKNPGFVVEVLAELAKSDAEVVAVFAGAGPLEELVKRRATELGLAERVRVLGWRDDTVELMRAADLFVFPRVETPTAGVGIEGLGLVVVEAQAAGLPMLISPGIPQDAIVNPELCTVRSIGEGPGAWAVSARDILARPRPNSRESLERVERSRFSLQNGLESLLSLYA